MKCVHKKIIFSTIPGRLLFLTTCSAVLFLGVSTRVSAEDGYNDYARTFSAEPPVQLDRISDWIEVVKFEMPKAASQGARYNECSGMVPCAYSGDYFSAGGVGSGANPGAFWTPFIKFTPVKWMVGDGEAIFSAYADSSNKPVLRREERNVTTGNIMTHTSNSSGTISFPTSPVTTDTVWEGPLSVTPNSTCAWSVTIKNCLMRDMTYFDHTSSFTVKVALRFNKLPSGLSGAVAHTFNNLKIMEFGHIISDRSGKLNHVATTGIYISGSIKIPDRCLISSDASGEIIFNDVSVGSANGLLGLKRVNLTTRCTGLGSEVRQYIKVTRKSGTAPVDQRYQIFAKDKSGGTALGLAMRVSPGAVYTPAACDTPAGNNNVFGQEYLLRTIPARSAHQSYKDIIDFGLCKFGIPDDGFGEKSIPITITSRWTE
ncbi:TPA: hypothetical protein RY449_001054 [Escherichia albertii]|uniref:hypothetical protein n=2 Tax=Escherichia albertii TaxID=208962 RepID=UPI000743462E|nr:hypothetical protein [Escherichia albertii]EEW0111854.1 hypothetical protein [Escherichia albertii]EFO0968185.1 hypothetical protein [Escherichia albertii]EFO4719680.1 hypothetical protein [Escherichia albertii]MCZ8851098.1 hypothetical protein [Escherichia albertii]MDD9755432.1 hypothetical protein [Escherichia albertii]